MVDAFCEPSRWGPMELPRPVPIGGDPDVGDFTPCFEELIIVAVIPAGILLLAVLASLRRFCSRLPAVPGGPGERQPLLQAPLKPVLQPRDAAFYRFRWVFAAKLLLHALVTVALLVELCLLLAATGGALYELVSTSICVFSWCVGIILSIMEFRRGLPTAPALVTFYLACILAGTIKLRTVLRAGVEYDAGEFLFFLQYALYFLILAVGMFAPSRSGQYDEDGNVVPPENRISWISKLTYWWISPLLRRGRERTLFIHDTALITDNDRSAKVRELVEKHLVEQAAAGQPLSLRRLVVSLMGYTFLTQAMCTLLSTASLFLGPFCMYYMIKYIGGEYLAPELVAAYLLGLLVGPLLMSVLDQLFMHQGVRIGMKLRAGLIHAIVQKTTRLSLTAVDMLGQRTLASLIETDAERLRDLPLYLHRIWSAPLAVVGSLLFLINFLNLAAVTGFGLMALMIPINVLISRASSRLQNQLLNETDKRVQSFAEVVKAMQAVKMLSLENFFRWRLSQKRGEELCLLKRYVYFQSLSFLLWQGMPVLVAVLTFGFYALVLNDELALDPAVVFVSLTLFQLIKMPLHLMPIIISKVREGAVSLHRIEEFLCYSEEIPPQEHTPDRTSFVSIKEGGFKWDNYDADLVLRFVNVDCRPQQMTIIVGPRGSGKTSLLHAILGEMYLAAGSAVTRGRIAFVGDVPFVQNATIRDNILAGRNYSVDMYERTVLGCGLVKDFLLLEHGDAEMLGNGGIRISESLQQRISVARGVYAMLAGEADMLVMDDPLTAVEPLLARRIVRECLGKALRNRTRIISTSQLALFLPESNHVVVLGNGMVVEQGPHMTLARQPGLLSEMLRSVKMFAAERVQADGAEEGEDEDAEVSAAISKRASSTPSSIDVNMGKITRSMSVYDIEGPANKGVPWKGWLSYASMSGGLAQVLVLALLFSLSQVGLVVQDFWMSWWTEDQYLGLGNAGYFKIFCYLGLYNLLFIVVRSLAVASGSVRVARRVHDLMLGSIMRAPLEFFLVTPAASTINRMGRDQQVVDQELSPEFVDLLTFVFMTAGMVVVIAWVTPFFLVAMLPIGIVLHFVTRYYIASARQLKRLDAESRTKVDDHYSELLRGLVTIRASDAAKTYIEESSRLVDLNHRAYWSHMVVNRWLGLRLEFVGSMVVFFCGIFVSLYRLKVTGGLAGISLMYALSVTNTLNWLVRTIAEVDAGLAHYARSVEFTTIVPESAAVVVDNRPPPGWPARGKISVQNLVVRPVQHGPPVLKGITFETKRMEKVGIVVQQSSTSSLLEATAVIHALLRLSEPDDGFVFIDNVDIGLFGLSDLRSALAVLPKSPLLFSGTLRENIDPEGRFTDEEIMRDLERVHMHDFVRDLPSGLDTQLSTEEDAMFSYGQLQLLALARVLLKKSKVVLIEEISSHMDATTDAILQKTIRTELVDCTVLTVASRLKTIIDYDRVIVLDKGMIVDFDSPAALINNEDSMFYTLCLESGEFEGLRQLAGQREYVLEELGASVKSGVSGDGSGRSYLNEQYFARPPAKSTAGMSINSTSAAQYQRDSRHTHGMRAQSFAD